MPCRNYCAVALGLVNWIEPPPLVVPVNSVVWPVDVLLEPLIWLNVPMKAMSLLTFVKIELDIDNIDEFSITRPSPVMFVRLI